MTQENYINSLISELESNDLVMVKFRTKAGTERVMGCTRNLEAVPQDKHDGINNPRLNGESIICVYDFQNSDWRSFRKDSVIVYTGA